MRRNGRRKTKKIEVAGWSLIRMWRCRQCVLPKRLIEVDITIQDWKDFTNQTLLQMIRSCVCDVALSGDPPCEDGISTRRFGDYSVSIFRDRYEEWLGRIPYTGILMWKKFFNLFYVPTTGTWQCMKHISQLLMRQCTLRRVRTSELLHVT
jgi:hypothetical protein